MAKTARWLPVFAAAAFAAAWWLVWEPREGQQPAAPAGATLADADAYDAANRPAFEPLALHSVGAETDAVAEAPPDAMGERARTAVASPDAPPDGYSFTAFHGDMATQPMTALDAAGDPGGPPKWLINGDALNALLRQAQAAGRDWTFGWVGIAPGTRHDELARELERHGARLLGRSATVARVRLPAERSRLVAIAGLPAVSGLAPTPADFKLAGGALAPRTGETVAVFITLMTDDPAGRWRQALTELGAEVGHFAPEIRVYAANVQRESLAALAAADFVLAVEPIGRATAAMDTAVPVMGADALRLYDDATGLFSGTGGASVPVGVMDTGLNINHVDIASNRNSICGANFVPFISDREEDLDLWIDAGLHGTHVTGTVLGSGSADPRYAGIAPLVQDIRFAKVIGAVGGSSLGVWRGMDFLARRTGCGGTRAKPLVVNASIAVSGLEWVSRSADERKLDAVIWNHRQLYVVSQANNGHEAFSNLAAAKNSLAVGAVHDGGDIAGFSSHGPTADGRLSPQVVGAGVSVVAARGNGRRSGYLNFNGTSMASPAVAGVAALLMDAVPGLREQPAAVRARLMASAIKPDAFLDDFAQFPLHNGGGPGALQHRYGLGKVSARTSVLSRDAADGWVSGAAVVELAGGQYGYHDVEVPPGASRLDIVMTWDERPTDTLVEPVLNDLDLWVDRDACGSSQTAACGNAASRSTKDNVEWLILRNPEPGVYRLKVVPKRAYVDAPRAALAWTVIRGPSTPQLDIGVDRAAVSAAPGQPFEVEATLTADGYVAAGTALRIDCRAEEGSSACTRVEFAALKASSVSREDAVSRSLAGESGDAIFLGEVAAGEEQRIKFVFRSLPQADRFRLYFTATGWNASPASTSVDVSVGEAAVAASPLAARPANDDFAAAERLTGVLGSREFDLLLATPQPGEPAFRAGLFDPTERPRSVWYVWTAPTSETYRFSIAPSVPDDLADDVQLDIFQAPAATPLVGMRSLAAKVGGGLTLMADEGETYRLRLSILASDTIEYETVPAESAFLEPPPPQPVRRRAVLPLTLHWSRGARPANDDFHLAAMLEGESGSLQGSNLGATLETGELFGAAAATTWHRWTAPADGEWRFEVNRRYLNVKAFVGTDVGNLRLVSGEPGAAAVFPVQAGAAYHVAVAATSAYVSGSDYALHWMPAERDDTGNDHLAAAEEIYGLPSFFHYSTPDFSRATVEPGEPIESGSRTVWWHWTAPLDGHYTWRADPSYQPVQLAAFAATSAADLAAVAVSRSDTRSVLELSFDASAGSRYWFSAGLAANAAFAQTVLAPVVFQWGMAPANDDFDAAEPLAGSRGRVFGLGYFATLEPGERAGPFGDSSMWYTWEADTAAWYRFSLNDRAGAGVVAVYAMTGDGQLGDLALVTTSRRLTRTAEAVFQAESGVRYAIRVGSDAWSRGGDFQLSWDEHGPPAWLRYAGSLTDGDLDAGGTLVETAAPRSLALNAEGTALYAATALGLQTYVRDAESGGLRLAQTLAGVDHQALLLWDAQTATLIAASCAGWQRFAPLAGGAGLAPAGELQGMAPCPGNAALRDASGSYIHIVRDSWAIETYRLDEERSTVDFVEAAQIFGVQAAVMGDNDDLMYVAAFDSLHVFARDTETGQLKRLVPDDVDGTPIPGYGDVRLLAVDASGRYLLAFSDGGRETSAFDLDDRAAPRHIASLGAFGGDGFFGFFPAPACRFVDMRTQTLSADVFCEDAAFAVRLLPESGTLRAEDYVQGGDLDVFGNEVPYFTASGDVVASADGKHVYVAINTGLLIFERSP